MNGFWSEMEEKSKGTCTRSTPRGKRRKPGKHCKRRCSPPAKGVAAGAAAAAAAAAAGAAAAASRAAGKRTQRQRKQRPLPTAASGCDWPALRPISE